KGIAVGDDNQGVVPANLAVTNDGIVLAAVAKLGSGNTDAWLVKLGFDGGIVWQKRFGGVGLDSFLDVIATSDGNLLAGGYLTTGNGDQDAWLVKVSPDGVVLAQRRFGGAANEQIRSLAEDTAHGAYVFVGTSGQDGLVGSVPAGDLAGCGAATSVTPVDTAALQAGWTPVASNFNVRSGTTAFLPAAAASTATSTCR
ncbi:MAG: hypothetical protein H6745_31160, partial [Deltaproteobacteria bacterium]|nr:hypothetical protein [Deltaproteobacteria bacterium]